MKNNISSVIYSSGLYLSFWLLIFLLEIKKDYKDYGLFDNILLGINLLAIIIVPVLVMLLLNVIIKKQWFRSIFYIVVTSFFTIIYEMYLFLLFYRFRSGFSFYFPFYWYNKHDAFITLFRVYSTVSFLFLIVAPIVILIIYYISLTKIVAVVKKKNLIYLLLIIFIINIASLIYSPHYSKGEMFDFIYRNFSANRELENYYSGYLNEHFTDLSEKTSQLNPDSDISKLGNKIFFVHLESVNSYLINENNTPNLLAESQKGIFFPEFYSNSISTLRSQENNLCGFPPSLKGYLTDEHSWEEIEKLSCLPRILKKFGYSSLFFKDDKLEFANTGEFMQEIGFDEVHNSDIMQPGDLKTDWGYREDIFFKRIFEYLDKHYKNQKIFIYIALSSSNHHPFKATDSDQFTQIPYESPAEFKERMSNTIFVQDYYLNTFFTEFEEYRDHSSLFLFSDHSWPIGIHPNNTFNEFNAFEENFLTFLIFTPPRNFQNLYKVGSVVRDRYSQMDTLPTILELTSIELPGLLGNSFADAILKENKSVNNKNSIITIQPYAGQAISVVSYPDKHLFDILNDRLLYYNLKTDPLESDPEILNINDYLYLISDFFNFYK